MSEDLDELTSSQRAALGQLQAITNGADISSEIAILASVNWDVQVTSSRRSIYSQLIEYPSGLPKLSLTRRHIPASRRWSSYRLMTPCKIYQHLTGRMFVHCDALIS